MAKRCGVVAILVACSAVAGPSWGSELVRVGRVQFPLPDGCQLRRLDIDPADGPGGCEIGPEATSASTDTRDSEQLIYHTGTLVCDGGRLEIGYDIGGNAGDYCADQEPVDLRFRVDGPLVRLCHRFLDLRPQKTRKEVLVLTVPEGSVNFLSDHLDAARVVVFLRLGRSIELKNAKGGGGAVEQRDAADKRR